MTGTKKDKGADTFDFDSSIAQLEKLVQRLEEDDSTLQKALEYFEQGIHLSREAQRALSAAEQQVNVLCEKNEEVLQKNLKSGEE